MDFSEVEVSEGLRFSWNGWPSSRIEASRCIIPLGVMWTPLQPLADALCPVSYAPLRCKGCEATLNPYCGVNFEAKTWNCPWCFQRNHFPATYSGVDESNLPAELYPNFSTIEYVLPVPLAAPPTFLFVVDLCQAEEELEHLKKALTHLLSLIPDTCPVGLISYSALVNVHEIGFADLSRAIVLRGDRELSAEKVKALLGLPSPSPPGFVVPLRDCDSSLSAALESLRPEHSLPRPGHRLEGATRVGPETGFSLLSRGGRPHRASGAALSVAVGLLDAVLGRAASARIVHFAAGPATVGPGMVVDTELSESLRSHSDILSNNTHFFRKATAFHTKLAQRLVERGFVYDLMAASLDQVGAAEAKVAVESSGGLLLLTESFGGSQFRGALVGLFACDPQGQLAMCFNAVLDVTCGREVKVTGAVGALCSMRKRGLCVSENQQGVGGTSSWKLCTLTPSTAVALFFEVVNQHTTPIPPAQPFFLQFTLEYVHSSGQRRVRVATCARRWLAASQGPELLQGFDQEAAAVLVARLAAFKAGQEEMADILRWVDRLLVRVAARFGEYEKNEPASFRLSSHLSLLPHFFYHLRRSPLLQTANSSPDETAFFRLALNRETVGNSLLIIQPTLLSYSFEAPPRATLLDVASIAPDCILLLDSFFTVVVHHGASIAQWRAMGYHRQPEHEAFKCLLESAMRDAEALVKERLPSPHLVVCDQNGSQARFLLAKLNPSSTHNNRVGSQEVIYTDDVSLEAFTMHLQKLAVQG